MRNFRSTKHIKTMDHRHLRICTILMFFFFFFCWIFSFENSNLFEENEGKKSFLNRMLQSIYIDYDQIKYVRELFSVNYSNWSFSCRPLTNYFSATVKYCRAVLCVCLVSILQLSSILISIRLSNSSFIVPK